MSRTNKSVSFDDDDKFEVELLEYAEEEYNGKKRNFSKFVKRLIAEQKLREEEKFNNNGGNQDSSPMVKERVFEDEETDPYTMEAMSGFL